MRILPGRYSRPAQIPTELVQLGNRHALCRHGPIGPGARLGAQRMADGLPRSDCAVPRREPERDHLAMRSLSRSHQQHRGPGACDRGQSGVSTDSDRAPPSHRPAGPLGVRRAHADVREASAAISMCLARSRTRVCPLRFFCQGPRTSACSERTRNRAICWSSERREKPTRRYRSELEYVVINVERADALRLAETEDRTVPPGVLDGSDLFRLEDGNGRLPRETDENGLGETAERIASDDRSGGRAMVGR